MKQFNIVDASGNRIHSIVADYYQYLGNVDRSYVFYVEHEEVARFIPVEGVVIHTVFTVDQQ